jgi:hypothetical protein
MIDVTLQYRVCRRLNFKIRRLINYINDKATRCENIKKDTVEVSLLIIAIAELTLCINAMIKIKEQMINDLFKSPYAIRS